MIEKRVLGDPRIRVVVGGQLPPPLSGQHLALDAALSELRSDDRLKVDHLPYRFSASIADQGRLSVRKAVGVGLALGRLAWRRLSGRINVFIHPIGGPSLSSTLKDLLLLPSIMLLSERTMLWFHGAGHGREWAGKRSPHVRLARRVLGRCDAAVVQSAANRVDPDWLGINRVFVIPLTSVDQLDASLVQRNDVDSRIRVVYIGHLGPHRGTPQLVGAVAALSEDISGLELDLAGDPALGYEEADLRRQIERVRCEDRIRYHGRVIGPAKSAFLGRAHILAFPSVFEAESFGLILVEGLMWGLPVVATDWRANREVLSEASDVGIHPHQPDLQSEIMRALRTMATALRRGEVPTFSSSNRAAFERRYLSKDDRSALADAAVVLARAPRRRLRKYRRVETANHGG